MVFPSFNQVVVRGVLEQAPRWLGTRADEMPQMTFRVTVWDDDLRAKLYLQARKPAD